MKLFCRRNRRGRTSTTTVQQVLDYYPYGSTRISQQSGAYSEKRPFYLLKWHSLMQMKELGVRRYDMWGLAEGDELAGVENFKLGFGGEVTPWIGALETPVTAVLFPLWRFGARRRLAAASA